MLSLIELCHTNNVLNIHADSKCSNQTAHQCISLRVHNYVVATNRKLFDQTAPVCRYKGVFDDNFSQFSSKPYVVTLHLNRLEIFRFVGPQHMFHAELIKIIPNYHQILPLI